MSLAPRLWRSLPDLDLTPADRKVLAILERAARLAKSPKFQSGLDDIAFAADISKRTVQRSIARLIEAGVVRKTVSERWNRHIPNTYELLRNWRRTQRDGVQPARQATGLTPLDYLGSKAWLVPTIASWLTENRPATFVEAFAGGAAIGLAVAHLRLADEVVLVEKDPDVAAFWSTVIDDNGGIACLVERCETLPVNRTAIEECLASNPKTTRERAFKRLVQSHFVFGAITRPDNAELLSRARLHRWNPTRIVMRLLMLNHLRPRIRFVEGDGLRYIRKYGQCSKTTWFFDPPHPTFRHGRDRLYQTPVVPSNTLFSAVAELSGPWIMTNENSPLIRDSCQQHGFTYRTPVVRSNNGSEAKSAEVLIGRNLSGLQLQPFKAFVGEKTGDQDAA
ncbi:MAG: MarR family transcriptional regulator [Bryobacterales bacterium]|nr:MarR family transcriptional regulator [Bryobacterales bacterium]